MQDKAVQESFELSPWQKEVMLTPERVPLGLLTGRGAGKTTAALYLVLRHIDQHGGRCWVIRKSFPGLEDITAELRHLISFTA